MACGDSDIYRRYSGNANSAPAARFAAGAIAVARAAGCSGTLVVRADWAVYSAAFTGAVRAAGAFFSVTVQTDPKVKAGQLAHKPPAAEGIDLRVIVPARLMLQFTWTGLDQLLAAYPA
jgi:hypothetical protein